MRNITVPTGAQAGDSGDFENSIVRSAVRRAIVRVSAESGIDDILKRGFSEGAAAERENSLESRIRQLAQRTLDEVGGGQGVGTKAKPWGMVVAAGGAPVAAEARRS